MSSKDLDRLLILKKLQAKELTQGEAGHLLRIGEREIRRLLVKFEEKGPKGIIFKLLGSRGNRSKCTDFKQRVLALLSEKYRGFGLTFAAEKLLEIEGLKLSDETVRQWMINNHYGFREKKRNTLHLPRARRSYFGELI